MSAPRPVRAAPGVRAARTAKHREPPGRGSSRGPSAALRGDIEGLRAVAVLMVLLYHAGVPGFSGGFAGVDVFFVISGYLITGLLVKEAVRDRRISIPRFYARRARRLLPAASLVLAVTALAGWWVLPRGRHAELGTDLLGATGYVVNWVFAHREVDYLAEDSEPSLLQHYWSLSVEEQFYVAWPLLIILVLWAARRYRLRFTRLLGVCLTALVLGSLAWSVMRTADSPGTAYFVTTTRAWQLGVGAMLVLVTPLLLRLSRRASHVLAWTGLAAVVATIFVVSTSTPWPGSAALLPTLGTAAVIAAGISSPDNRVGQLLGRRPMRFLGALSYGLYLWHWPALRILAEVDPDAGLHVRLAVAALSVLLAWLSLHLVENPLRFNAALAALPSRALTYGATSMVVTGALGAALLISAPQLDTGQRDTVLDVEAQATPRPDAQDGGPAAGPDASAATDDADTPEPVIDRAGAIGLVRQASRTQSQLEPIADPAQIYTQEGEIYPDPQVAIKDIPLAGHDEECQVPADSEKIVAEDACWFGDPEGDTTVALVGDSKMLQWLTAVDVIAQSEGWRVKVYTKSGCGFATISMYPECHAYNESLSALLSDGEHTPDIVLTSMVRTGGQELGESVADLLRPVREAGAKVVVIGDNPSPARDELGKNVTLYGCVADHPDDYSACSYQRGPGSGSPALRAAAEAMDVPFVDVAPWVCPDTGAEEPSCPPVIGRVLVFRQGSHLTATYVASLTPILHHQLVGAGVADVALEDIPWRLPEGAQG